MFLSAVFPTFSLILENREGDQGEKVEVLVRKVAWYSSV